MTQAQEKRFRWAIAGYGKVAAGGHHLGLHTAGHELVGFTTSDAKIQGGDASHIKFNWETTGMKFDVKGMVVSERPDDAWLCSLQGKADAVLVAVPTQFHVEVVERVLRAGFHCLVEKPFADTAAEAEQLMQLAAKLERQLLVAQVLPALQEFAALRAAILERGLDQLVSLSMRRWVPWQGVDAYDEIAIGTGYFKDLAVHDCHFLSSFGGYLEVGFVFRKWACNRVQRAQDVELIVRAAPNAKVTLDVGANAQLKGSFEHGFDAEWTDGSRMSLKYGVLTTEKGIVALEPQSVGEIFGSELRLAAKHFRDGSDPDYLAPCLACDALRLIETATRYSI